MNFILSNCSYKFVVGNWMLNWHDISASLLGVQNDNFKFRECFWTTFTLSYKTATHHMPYLQQIVTYFVVYFKFMNSWTHVKINNSKEIKISSTQRGAILEDTKITMGWHLTLVTILFYFCWSIMFKNFITWEHTF